MASTIYQNFNKKKKRNNPFIVNSQKDNDRSPTETLGDDKEERSSFPKVVVGNLLLLKKWKTTDTGQKHSSMTLLDNNPISKD